MGDGTCCADQRLSTSAVSFGRDVQPIAHSEPKGGRNDHLMTTIKDVARVAGVATSTVSRVLAGSSRISPDTHEKVRQAMRDLNYHPNAIARSLARKSTGTLGLVISRSASQAFANPFFPEVLRGIGSSLQEEGYSLMLSMTSSPAEERSATLRLLRQRRVDGVILTAARTRDRLIDDLLKEEYPFVVIGRVPEPRPVNWVNNDNAAVGAMAVEHLLEKGHRRIGFIHGPDDLTVTQDRRQGYANALHRAGIIRDEELEVDGEFTKEGGCRAMRRLLTLREPPTACFCTDDLMAVGALGALKEVGLDRSVALIGVNDDPLAPLLDPPLSTIRIPIFDLGQTAARLLIDLLTRRSAGARQVILPSQLVVRESSNWTLK